MCLAKCLKFREFEAGCAYKLVAYKKKRVIEEMMNDEVMNQNVTKLPE